MRNFKVTVNQALEVEKYPLPKMEDIFVNLRQAYLQFECEDASKEILTIYTHKGLFTLTRMIYGIGSEPAIWHEL